MKRVSVLSLLKSRFAWISEKELFARVLCGEVLINGQRIADAGTLVRHDSSVDMLPGERFVSRGGVKLDHVITEWDVSVRDGVFLDAGASTGGFTDCLLQKGAALVYAVDVGYNLIDYKLRKDPRVEVFERTNILSVSRQSLREFPRAAVMDLSFRSLRGAAAHVLELTTQGWMITLAKPQFEWIDPPTDFHGVVHDRDRLLEILACLVRDLHDEGAFVAGARESPLRGRRGNREFFFLLTREPEMATESVVESLRAIL